MSKRNFLTIAIVSIFASSIWSAPPRSITPEDLWAVKRVGAPSTSPDGGWAVVEVTTYDVPKDESSSDLWLLSTDGTKRRQLTAGGVKSSGPKWSPDGKAIAFTSTRTGDDHAQIYVIAPDGGEARRVGKLPFAPSSLKWAGDSRTVYCIGSTWPGVSDEEHTKREKKLKDDKSKAIVIDDAAFRYWDHWIADGKRPQVFAVDVASGQHKNLLAATGKWLPPYDPSDADYDISPNGKELAFVSENVKEIGLDNNNDIFVLPLDKPGAAPINVTPDNPAHDTNPAYSNDGQTLAFIRQTTKFFYADRTRLMLCDRANGKIRGLTDDYEFSVGHPQWLPDGKRIAVEVESRGTVGVAFVTTDPPRVGLTPSIGTEKSISFAAKERMGVYLGSNFDLPPTVFAHSPAKPQPVRMESFNEELVSQWKLGKVENVTFKGAADKDVQMWIVFPPNFDKSKKWPLVQMVHGGPHNAITADFSYRWNPQVWAARGWVIAIVNFHGSSGFGQEFTDSITGDLGTKPLTDIMRSTEWFEKQPWIDATRMAAAGGSYGGYMMAWLNGHTDKFKAHVCHAGVYNWHSMMASDSVRGRERSLGAPPWGDLDKIDKQNAQRFAKEFKTPTLVVHGEKDFRVPVTQGLEYYNTLRQKGVPTRLLYFPDENHWVLKPNNALVWHREVFAWLDKYIGNGPK